MNTGVLQICDTLSELAGKIPDVDKTWPELLPFIFSCVQSGDPRLMEAALNVFAELARSMMTTLMQYMGTLHQVRQYRHHSRSPGARNWAQQHLDNASVLT